MSRYHSYINTAKEIINEYKGEEPLSSFLKKKFSGNKKYGSTDRKKISHLCYSYFRLGRAAPSLNIEERILMGLFLCSDKPDEILALLKPGWNEKVSLSIKEKCSMLNAQCSISNVFPWKEGLSVGIDHEKFCESFFVQPDLFLRLRPGKENTVREKLQKAGIEFEIISEKCLSLPNASKIENIIELDAEAVIQDYNSQQTGRFLSSAFASLRNDKPSVWDCCAGSGGKSIMANDINLTIDLTVSDIRESIVANLRKRFANAGIKNFKSFVADLTGNQLPVTGNYNVIIADVPCSGSGTWSRTPEQLYFFNENKIDEYAALQKRIVSNVIPQLQPGGSFVYITCSVFRKENEEVVMFINENFDLNLKQMEILKGYEKKADSMFVAVFEKL